MRLNKFISENGICSRREADRYIENGHVFINGKRAAVGAKVNPGDRVRVNGIDLEPREQEDTIFIALNKPPGITSTTEEGVKDNIVRFVNHSKRVFPVGRLDKDSQGLILLTNDGDMVNKILRAGNNHEKEYIVTVNKPLTPEVIAGMSNGVPMLGVMTKKCKIVQETPHIFRVILIQGLNRQIRRMCDHFGYEVTKLERVRIMHIQLKRLPLGDWRDLTPDEVSKLHTLVAKSSSEDNKKKAAPHQSKKPKGIDKKPSSKPASKLSSKSFGKSRPSGSNKNKQVRSSKRSGRR
jgi:23S rRNA pseudouridine2604 synthase